MNLILFLYFKEESFFFDIKKKKQLKTLIKRLINEAIGLEKKKIFLFLIICIFVSVVVLFLFNNISRYYNKTRYLNIYIDSVSDWFEILKSFIFHFQMTCHKRYVKQKNVTIVKKNLRLLISINLFFVEFVIYLRRTSSGLM